jgi:uncharacterized membrane protein required for colicin V production
MKGAPVADLAILIGLGVFFFLGVLQGTFRRLLGIGAATAAFLIAANVRDSAGSFLAGNWKQFSLDYNRLIAFVLLFLLLFLIGQILIQVTYKRVLLWARHPVVDEVVGGMLGLLEAFVLLLFVVIILNSYKLPDAMPGDVGQIRDLQNAVVGQSQIAHWVREAVAPVFVHIVGILLPTNLTSLFS